MYKYNFKEFFQFEFIKYLFIGLVNTIFGYSVYSIFIYIGLNYSIALMMATTIGVIFNYNTYRSFLFNKRGERKAFIKFLSGYVMVYFVNLLLLGYLNLLFNEYISQMICIPPVVIFNWIIFKYWVFK
ncbi:GtrA family protein [Vibrio spartinae]|uniref:GtrA-like protein n=1 Tax=Vibrio spartinae TaxID=1918945 RepID=A0ABX6QVB1_9VIBR|nr:GtrA-like protein [Vibrio spartinae]